MKNKPPIYWALVSGWSSMGAGVKLMKVTSEKYHQIYGSTDTDGPTHRTKESIVAKFPSREAAEAAIKAIVAVRKKYQPLRDALNKQENELRKAESAEVARVVEEGAL